MSKKNAKSTPKEAKGAKDKKVKSALKDDSNENEKEGGKEKKGLQFSAGADSCREITGDTYRNAPQVEFVSGRRSDSSDDNDLD